MIELTNILYLGKAQPEQGGGTQINNQNITVTENGQYTAAEGYTGLGTVTVNVPAQSATVQAVNKTGSAITSGDKVWLNQNAYIGETKIQPENGTSNSYMTPGIITPDGNYFIDFGNFYHVGINGIEKVGSWDTWSGSMKRYFILEDGKIYSGNQGQSMMMRLDYPNNWTGYKNIGFYVGQQYTFQALSAGNKFNKFDPDTGTILYSADVEGYSYLRGGNCIILNDNNIIYSLYNNLKWTITDTGSSLSLAQSTYNNAAASDNNVFVGYTNDRKYIFVSSGSTHANGQFNLLAWDSETETLSQAEIPSDMQPFSGKSDVYVFWNGHGQVLSFYDKNTDSYAIFKYSTQTGFVKQSVTLPDNFINMYKAYSGYQFLSVNDACDKIAYYEATNINSMGLITVINLETVTGYAASQYSPYNVTADSITGYAAEDAAIDASFEANVAGE